MGPSADKSKKTRNIQECRFINDKCKWAQTSISQKNLTEDWWKKCIICLLEDYNVASENGWRDNFSKKALTLAKLIMTTKESKESQITELT